MDLKNKITADLKTAMLARDAFTTNILRGLKAAILDEEVKSGKREEGLDNAEIEKIFLFINAEKGGYSSIEKHA